MDLSGILSVVLSVVSPILTACAVMGVKYLLDSNKIKVTAQERAAILGAVQTSAGMLTTRLAQGAITLNDVKIGSPAVDAVVNHVTSSMVTAIASQKTTTDGIANMIIGAVGNKIGEDPTVPTIPATTPRLPIPAAMTKAAT